MQEKRLIELLVNLHKGLPRLGPGNTAATLKALGMCSLPDQPRILDVGCGTGAQSFVLARATNGYITAADLFPVFLEQLSADARTHGLHKRIHTVQADMNALPFSQGQFDLIWCEGAISIMGFGNGLAKWRPFVKPGGYVVISDLTWFTPDTPEDLQDFFLSMCPDMQDSEGYRLVARKAGYTVKGGFRLTTKDWLENYYGPLEQRLPDFRKRFADDELAQELVNRTEQEISLRKRYPDQYGYEFYVLKRPER